MYDICMKGFVDGYYSWTAHGEAQVLENYDDQPAPVCLETPVALGMRTQWGGYKQMNWDQRMVSQWASDLLPRDHTLPSNYYNAKKMIRDLGLPVEKIHACRNSCMLYWKDDIDMEYCKF
ncbi:UNVERIFIED_CONTAM: hypothetical protein Sangu_1720200 [Sesamum angustifolium]|uniref:Uncharacterized protein n=1 Tax=Sesamum angustifolium TaxID=2727405 RepID=A0AAW2MKE5_9LAMI